MELVVKNLPRLDELIKEIKAKSDDIGAIVIFIGVVRKSGSAVDNVDYMVYEAHKKIAEDELQKILEEANEKFGLIASKAIHVIGKVARGEDTVYVISAAKHRKEAFRGAEYIIDEIKVRLPIWKKELSKEGERWVKPIGKHDRISIYLNGKKLDLGDSEKEELKLLLKKLGVEDFKSAELVINK